MNGSEQSVGKDGYFTLKCDLQLGKNKITFLNGEYEKVFTIIYSQPLIKSYTPSDSKLTLDGGSPLSEQPWQNRERRSKPVTTAKQ